MLYREITAICSEINKKHTHTLTGINLLCAADKIFSNIPFNRLLPYVETTIGDYQCDYRGERSTVDQIFTICQIWRTW